MIFFRTDYRLDWFLFSRSKSKKLEKSTSLHHTYLVGTLYLKVKTGLHLHANGMRITHVDVRRGKMYGTFVHCSAFAEAANRPYINLLYVNFLWCTDSRRIVFGCLPNVCRTAECCLPSLGNTSTSNIRIVFECRVLFVFRCKHGVTVLFKINFIPLNQTYLVKERTNIRFSFFFLKRYFQYY